MSNAVFFNTYKLKGGASVPDFLQAVEDLYNGYCSKQKGLISFKLLSEGDMWADYSVFETMEDAKRFADPSDANLLAEHFYSFLDFDSCKSHLFSVEQSCLPNE